MDRWISIRDLRRAIGRDKKANWLQGIVSPQLAGEFKTNQCSQTVAKECERLVQKRKKGLSEGVDERRESSERWLHQPSSSSGKLHRTDLNMRWQAVRPGAKNRDTASRIREAE
jgi:hypothetical protein